MSETVTFRRSGRWQASLDRFAEARPDLVLVLPLMIYIVLLSLVSLLPPPLQPAAIVLRGVASVAVVLVFWRHLPPFGAPFWPVAIGLGAIAAWGWIVGQYAFDQLGLGGRLPIGLLGEKQAFDPRSELGADDLFWTTWWLRMLVAVLAVPIVEEIFWRGFLLRALVDWSNFERVPLGTFTWLSFLGTSLISTLQHPDNWGVSILCWMLFNGVFYWTRSLLCLILLHGFTNLVLYLMTLRVDDWSFW